MKWQLEDIYPTGPGLVTGEGERGICLVEHRLPRLSLDYYDKTRERERKNVTQRLQMHLGLNSKADRKKEVGLIPWKQAQPNWVKEKDIDWVLKPEMTTSVVQAFF